MIKKILKNLLPYGIVKKIINKKEKKLYLIQRNRFHQEREKAIARGNKEKIKSKKVNSLNYFELIEFLKNRGLIELQVKEGSMPEESLKFVRQKIEETQKTDEPIYGVHIGNYVGVSLCYLTGVLKKIHDKSKMISIDPNIPHRGTENPSSHVAALLNACELGQNSLILVGFSGKKNISNDGVEFEGYKPEKEYKKESAVEEVLDSVAQILPKKISLACIDGNHEPKYLKTEILKIKKLLKPEALLVLDDVSIYWEKIQDIYQNNKDNEFQKAGTDGRVGLLIYRPNKN